ncbi:MAG: hypothetical protein M1822_004486 [Bathelium mastoideum]|nr:MAG: hypothetical protein M1822_004486 [Bathelium mastoideum]
MTEHALDLQQPTGRKLVGGDLLAQSLYALGVRVAFGLHGGHLDSFLMGCEEAGISLVDTRHETVAVQAAEGYAKVKGYPSVGCAFVTANSGFSNALPGLASALADRSPVFVVTASPPLRDAETNTLQGFHQQDIIAKPLTKFSHRVTVVEEIPRIVAHAFRTTLCAPPGPVLIDFPIDILFTPPREPYISWGSITKPLPYPPTADPRSLLQLLEMLKESERPCIVTSTGNNGPEGANELRKFVEATQVPLFNSTKYSAFLPHDHPLRGGPVGNLAALPATGQKQPDLIILLGVRTGFFLGARSGAIIPNRDCKLVQIDIDGAEIGRSHPVDLGIVSDAGLALAALNTELQRSVTAKASSEWVKIATSLKDLKSPLDKDPKHDDSGRIHPYHAFKTVFETLAHVTPSPIIIMDGGEASCWEQDLVDHAHAHKYLVAVGYLGFLGNGWGYSLGAAIAAPDRLIVNMQGDGSAGFHIAELDTFARHNLNICTMIFNNSCWGMSQNGQELIYGKHTQARPATQLSPACAYEVVGQGFGCLSARVDKFDDIAQTVTKLGNSGKASCINFIISDKPIVGATTAMVGASDDPNVIVVPYYDNLPLPRYD